MNILQNKIESLQFTINKFLLVHKIKRKLKNKPNAVLFLLTPLHSNMGDHAICCSIIQMFKRLNIEYIELTINDLAKLKGFGKLDILDGRTLIINGGGNLGTLWFSVEELTRDIISNNKNSKIFIMPNSFFYEESEWGQKELKNSIKLYNSHNCLKIYAREKISYEKMKDIYRDVELIPDMVLNYKIPEIKNFGRKGCLLCLRNDLERTLNDNERQQVVQSVSQLFDVVKNSDMHSNKPQVEIKERECELKKKLSEFMSSELVITDRLHGMIFAAITGTPCIVVNSKSPKMKGCYDWIKDLEYIKYCGNVTEIMGLIKTIPLKNYEYNNLLSEYFLKLEKEFLRLKNER